MKALSHAILWNGFSYRWRKNPHRLAILGSRFEEQLLHKDRLQAWHRFRSRIGNWPEDSLDYYIPYSYVQAEKLFLGTATVHCQVSAWYNEAGSLSFEAQIPLNSLQANVPFHRIPDTGNCRWMAFLNGFHLSPANNPSGWHFGEFAIESGRIRFENELLHLPLEIRIRPSKNPEPVEHGNENWVQRPHCTYNLALDLLVLADPEGLVEKLEFSQSISEKGNRGFSDMNFFRQVEDLAGEKAAFSAIRGFSIKLGVEDPGLYVRGLTCQTEVQHLDLEARTCVAGANLSFSNEGKWPLRYAVDFAMECSLVLAPAANLKVEQNVLKGRMAKGQREDEQIIEILLNNE